MMIIIIAKTTQHSTITPKQEPIEAPMMIEVAGLDPVLTQTLLLTDSHSPSEVQTISSITGSLFWQTWTTLTFVPSEVLV